MLEGVDSGTNVDDFISDLGGGTVKQKLSHLLSGAALGAVTWGQGKKGKVTLELTIQKVGENEQVIISHKLSHNTPTKRGHKAEVDTTETPMFVGKNGKLTITQPRVDNNGQRGLKLT